MIPPKSPSDAGGPGSVPRTPDWLLERIALGELSEPALTRARAQLAAEPDGTQRLAALERDGQRLLADLPPAQLAAEVRRRLSRAEAPVRPARQWLALPVLVAAAAMLLLLPRARLPSEVGVAGPEEPTERVKGTTSLRVHRQRPDGTVEQLPSGARAQRGDLIQLSVVPRTSTWAVVVSVDGRGAVTRHLPEEGEAAAHLEPGAARQLPHAYQLDDAPSFERFVLVTSDAPFEVAPVLAAAANARAGEPLDLPSRLAQRSVVLDKAGR